MCSEVERAVLLVAEVQEEKVGRRMGSGLIDVETT